MAELAVNNFAAWRLSEEEERQGSIFTITQAQVLQNELSIVADSIIGLKFTPEEPLLFAQQEAELRGKLEFIQYLLDRSESLQQLTSFQAPSNNQQ